MRRNNLFSPPWQMVSLVYSPLLSRYLSRPQAGPLLRFGLLSLLLLLPGHAQAA